MSSILQKHVLSLLKRGVSRQIANPVHITDATLRQLHRASARTLLTEQNLSFQSTNSNARIIHSASQPTLVLSEDESRELMALWPDVVRDLTDVGHDLDIADAIKWWAKALEYNVPGGTLVRGLACVLAYRYLASPEQLTEERIRLVRILGWCIELWQASLLIIDDIQDGSVLRKKKPCWHLQNDIGLAAINDAILLEMSIYQLLRTHCKKEENYIDIVEIFQEHSLKLALGQNLDLQSSNFGKRPNLNLFTMDRYNAILKYKVGYCTFYMPIAVAMCLAGIKDPEMHRQTKTILLEMGHFFQVQDDYLDSYGDPQMIGKIGTDIAEGKCSWLVVVALQRATQKQREILEECYGVKDPEKIARVKQLYNDIDLPNVYSIYEEETYNLLLTHIQQISRGLPHDFFLKILNICLRTVIV